jgi:oxygen-dependent protoporphyrinogen oxidase
MSQRLQALRGLFWLVLIAQVAGFPAGWNLKLPKGAKGIGRSGSGSIAGVESVDALVVGSGISGSTAAFYLHKKGVNVVLTEARDVVGGNLISKRKDGYLWEEGPNSFQPNPAILRFAKDLGMIDKLVLAEPTLPRFVFWENKLFALPGGIPDAVFNFNLLDWPAKIRAGLGALGLVAARPDFEETIQEFVTRHLGPQVFERVIDPFVSGVYAGNPRKLSMKAALKKVYNLEDLGFNSGFVSGAIVRMQQIAAEKERNRERDADLPTIPGGSLGTFADGLQSLPLAVQEQLPPSSVRVSHKLTAVKREASGSGWRCTFETPSGPKVMSAKALLMTAPGYVTSKLVGEDLVPAAKALAEVDYPPVASVTVAYPNSAFKDGLVHEVKGFGHLIPRLVPPLWASCTVWAFYSGPPPLTTSPSPSPSLFRAMKVRTLGTIWSSSLFPGRAPEGFSMLLNYIGGAQDVAIADLTEEQIVAQVHADVSKVLLVENPPLPKVLGCRVWPRAIPQYNKGHLAILKAVEEGCKDAPGIFLGGNYRTGVAFGDCVQYGADVATEVATYLETVEASTSSDPVPVAEAVRS